MRIVLRVLRRGPRPLALGPGRISTVQGVRLSTTAAGIRYRGRDDLLLIELAEGGSCAAVFTRNAFCAAPVIVAREHLAASAARPRATLAALRAPGKIEAARGGIEPLGG